MKDNKIYQLLLICATLTFLLGAGVAATKEDGKIVHDAEYYILEAQNGERWAAEDKELDRKLAELRKKYGQPPNIVYILWDDTAFGAAGFPGLQKNFGYETPNMNKMAAEGINWGK
jgi:arylsulfatase